MTEGTLIRRLVMSFAITAKRERERVRQTDRQTDRLRHTQLAPLACKFSFRVFHFFRGHHTELPDAELSL